MHDMPTARQVEVSILGALLPPEYGNLTDSFLEVWVELIQTRSPLSDSARKNVSHHINKTDILFTKVRATKEFPSGLVSRPPCASH